MNKQDCKAKGGTWKDGKCITKSKKYSNPSGSKAKKIAIGIGIAVVLAIFIGFLAYEIGNSVEKKCTEEGEYLCCQYEPIITNPEITPVTRSRWVTTASQCIDEWKIVDESLCKDKTKPSSSECRDKERMYFSFTTAGLGLIAVIVGIFIAGYGAISGGLITGGIISMIMALVQYWSRLEGWMRVAVAGILLTGLIILAYYKLKD